MPTEALRFAWCQDALGRYYVWGESGASDKDMRDLVLAQVAGEPVRHGFGEVPPDRPGEIVTAVVREGD